MSNTKIQPFVSCPSCGFLGHATERLFCKQCNSDNLDEHLSFRCYACSKTPPETVKKLFCSHPNCRKGNVSEVLPKLTSALWPIPWKDLFMTKSFTPITEPVYDFLTHGGRLHIGGVGGEALLATDEVYPCCSQGSNRSQVLYRVLVDDFKHRKVHLPHGLVSGYDPHAAYQKLTYDNWFDGYICDGAVEQDMFAKAFEMVFPGFRKSPKLGQREADGLTLNMDDYMTVALEDLERDRAFMRRWFDEHVYGSVPATGVRKVFVCFAGPGLKILLQRLREQRHLANFNHIYIMVLPYDDEASRAAQTRGSSDFHSSVARAFSHMRELYRAINYTP